MIAFLEARRAGGATKMGSVIRFIPAPVIIHFTAGIELSSEEAKRGTAVIEGSDGQQPLVVA
jgi:hypothetical protein